jgi:MFS family permease
VVRRLESRGYIDASLRTSAFSAVGMFILCVAIPFTPGEVGALCVAAGIMFFTGVPIGIVASALQHATPSRMQGVVASFYTFAAQLIGYGVGPTAVALFTDKVFMNPARVGFSMQIVMCMASLIAGWMLFSVLPHYRDVLAARADTAAAESGQEVSNLPVGPKHA